MTEKEAKLTIQPLRINPHYVMWYKNVTTFLLFLFIPLCMLAYLNYNTYEIITRRKRLRNRPFPDENLEDQACISRDEAQGCTHSIGFALSSIIPVVIVNPLFDGAMSSKSSARQKMALSSSQQGMANNYFLR